MHIATNKYSLEFMELYERLSKMLLSQYCALRIVGMKNTHFLSDAIQKLQE